MLNGKRKYILAFVVLFILYILGLRHSDTRLTYLEYSSVNEKKDTFIALNANNDELKQEFIMPYDIFDSVSIQIGTFAHDNNSVWIFCLSDSSGKVLYEDSFNASRIEDNQYYRHKIDKKLGLKKGDKYYFTIKAQDVSDLSKLAFYVSLGNNTARQTKLLYNGAAVDSTLCFKIYGGDKDYWWHGFVTVIFLYLLAILLRLCVDDRKKKSIREDKVLQGMILGAVVFLLLYTFAINGQFTDENDNMRGGMVIANGGVLYRDYVTQHTPVVYYLCSLFALLGAGSIEQFRLSYYAFVAIFWLMLYLRHRDHYGERKMIILPLLETVCISSIGIPTGFQILSEGFVGLMFVALMLEFLRYYEDRSLGWKRSIIISICLWGSLGAAFLSAYALVFLALIFVFVEAEYLNKEKPGLKKEIRRYSKPAVSIIVPFLAAILYFKANHALKIAFDQFYTFNREVYPKYTSGLGDRIIQPFVNAVQNFVRIIADSFNDIITASATNEVILRLVLIGLAVGIIIKLIEKKHIVQGLSLGFMMIFSATRGYEFHGLAAWYLAILIISIYIDLVFERFKKLGKPVLGIMLIILASIYFDTVGDNLLSEQQSISELESKVVEMTEQEDNKDIFLDAFCCDSLYLFYKNRKPVNPAVYMLPWYMDWYEKWDVDALLEKRPHIVVYHEERETWGITHYTYVFDTVLKQHYTRVGDDGWQCGIWLRNEENDSGKA